MCTPFYGQLVHKQREATRLVLTRSSTTDTCNEQEEHINHFKSYGESGLSDGLWDRLGGGLFQMAAAVSREGNVHLF